MTKTLGNFMLKVVEGEYTDSQIIVLLGENGAGKSTFLQMLVHLLYSLFTLKNMLILFVYAETAILSNVRLAI